MKKGFSLIEVLVGSALFLVVAIAAYGAFSSLFQLAMNSQNRMLAVELADEQFEIIRNMPYMDVGLLNGIPQGLLPQTQVVARGGAEFTVNLTVRNVNLSTSTVEASDKLVEVQVTCPGCRNFQPVTLTGQISPANLQSAGDGGALVIQAFNGNGEPVPGAIVDVQSMATSSIRNNDITNNYGVLNIIGVPPGNNMYKVRVSKPGYSTEETFPIGEAGNPNPTKPNVTVLDQQVSQISFAIDRLGSLHFSSVSPQCEPVGNVNFTMIGSKTIGLNLPKYSRALETGISGLLNLDPIEWDTYSIVPTDASYDVSGINPYSPFTLSPNNSQNIQLVVVDRNPNSLMVSVEDHTTRLPVSGATVELARAGYSETLITGEGYMSQTDWTGGSGQTMFSDETKYFEGIGVETATSSGDIILAEMGGGYALNATSTLESSIFDTGTTSNFYTFSWAPSGQPILAGPNSVQFQFASNASSTPSIWEYFGPDGTSNTFFTVPGSSINAIHNGKRFARYMTFLNTNNASTTPTVSNVEFSYTSGCIPPGQVLFQGLSFGDYVVTVTKSGYALASTTVAVASGWQVTNMSIEQGI